MAHAGPSLDAEAQLLRLLVNKRFNAKATAIGARRTISDLTRCKATYLEWKEAEENAKREGRSLFHRVRSEQTQSGLLRIARLSQKLHRELTELPTGRRGRDGTGHVFMGGVWAECSAQGFDTVVESVAEIDRVSMHLWQQGHNSKHGTPGMALRRAFAVMDGATLERAGYRVTNSAIGAFSRVMALMLVEVGEKAPRDMRELAATTSVRVRNPPAYLRRLKGQQG